MYQVTGPYIIDVKEKRDFAYSVKLYGHFSKEF